MSQIVDQITAEETANIQAQKEQLDAQVAANVLARLQATLQSAKDKRANMDSDIADLEGEIGARMPQAEQPAEAQG